MPQKVIGNIYPEKFRLFNAMLVVLLILLNGIYLIRVNHAMIG
jgi:hypothetical protein